VRSYTPIYRGGGFRVASYNIDSLRSLLKKPAAFISFLAAERFSALFLQEGKLPTD
jgi:exonuclease III